MPQALTRLQIRCKAALFTQWNHSKLLLRTSNAPPEMRKVMCWGIPSAALHAAARAAFGKPMNSALAVTLSDGILKALIALLHDKLRPAEHCLGCHQSRDGTAIRLDGTAEVAISAVGRHIVGVVHNVQV